MEENKNSRKLKDEEIVNKIIDDICDDEKIQENEENIITESDDFKKVEYTKIKKKKKIHFSYEFRLTLSIITFIFSVIMICFFATQYIKVNKADIVNYTENGKINYRVLLKDNKYYDENYVDQNMMYVANLIDKIEINFDYDLFIDRLLDCNVDYNIVANLIIKDGVSDKIFYNKKYDLAADHSESTNYNNNYNKSLLIDYPYYNLLASQFKGDLGVDTESFLRVSLNIKKNSNEVLINDSNIYIDIPLSERAFEITISPMKLNNNSQTIKEANVEFGDKKNLVFIVVFAVICLISLIRIIRLISKALTKKSNYQKYIAKLLREYDRLIVETVKVPDFSEMNVNKVVEFKELLDVRDNLKLPIIFTEVNKNHKAYFYIQSDNNVYLYVVKDLDMSK